MKIPSNAKHYFLYESNLTDEDPERIIFKIVHKCPEGCNTENINLEMNKEEFMEEDDKGVAYINKMLIDKDEAICTLLHEMHDLICIKKSMIKI